MSHIALPKNRRTQFRSWLAGGVAVLLGVSAMISGVGPGTFGASAAAAADYAPSKLRIEKSVTVRGVTYGADDAVPVVEVGEQFDWHLSVICDQISDQCVAATLTDVIPAEFEIAGEPNVAGLHETTIAGQTVTVKFLEALNPPIGTTGLSAGSNVTIPVKLRAIDQGNDGKTFTNTASVVAQNAPQVSDDASVQAAITLGLAAEASKAFDDEQQLATPGKAVGLSFGGKNTSNGPVQTLTVQDPADPEAAPNVFSQFLALESIGDVTWPEGAQRAIVSVTTDGGATWSSADPVALNGKLAFPAGMVASTVQGVRVTFIADNPVIPANAATSVHLSLTQRDSVNELTSPTSLSNVSSAITTVADLFSERATATDTLSIVPAGTSVSATKSFNPQAIASVSALAGAATSSTVTLGAENTGSLPLKSLTISEPSDPSDRSASNLMSSAHPEGSVIFAGFTDGVSWPNGADKVSVTYHFDDGSAPLTLSSAKADTLPAVPESDTRRVSGFSITYTGEEIGAGAQTTAPFVVDAHPEQVALLVNGSNTITVSGETTDDARPNPEPQTATDTLSIYAAQIAVETKKLLTDSELWSLPGQTTTARLEAKIAAFPLTTHPATQVIIDDPAGVTGTDAWYESFNATAVTLAQIPANATLTVQYRDAAGVFTTLPGMNAINGATNGIFSAPIPAELRDQITGIRFIYNSVEGFVPGQNLRANVTYALRSTLRTGGAALPNAEQTLTNTVGTQASNEDQDVTSIRVEDNEPIILKPTDGSGIGALSIDKSWDPEIVFSHSRMNTQANLTWGTNGVQGLDRVVISDTETTQGGAPVPVAQSSFDAFNLTAIGPITDPRFKFDRVQVQLFNDVTQAWENASACTLASPCTGGTIPKITLNETQIANTRAVRFVVTENTAVRNASTEITDPRAGSGVATGNGRVIPLTFTLRDTLRSNPAAPVVEGPTYNAGTPSRVNNVASIESFIGVTPQFRGTDSDSIELIDPTLAVTAKKTWEGGSIAIPNPWNTAPTTRVTVSATNQTVGGEVAGQQVAGLVNELRIVEPGAQSSETNESPFEQFSLIGFDSLTAPKGTTEVRIELATPGGGVSVIAPTAALALTSLNSQPEFILRTVTGITVIYTGAIQSGATVGKGSLTLDLELRQFMRTSGAPVTVANSPVGNTVLGQVTDQRFDGTGFVNKTLADDDKQTMTLTASTISVTAGKSFSPTTQVEPSRTPVTMTLTAKPGGTERPRSITLTDDQATFWNAYDFLKLSSTLALPTFSPGLNAAQIEVSVCTARDFSERDADSNPTGWDATGSPAAGCEETGGSWSTFTTPMTQAAAKNWAPSNASEVEGIRVRITRLDSKQWENPQAPTISIPVEVQRRETLRGSGDPVPSTLKDGGPIAPGETVKGVTTNTVTANLVGIWGGTANAAKPATLTYVHAKNSVQVQKDPIGVKQPGVAFDYTLTVKNTGDRDVIDPVITDLLPWNAELGTLVQFSPDADPTAPRYAYLLSGPTAADGPALPTDATAVTVKETLTGDAPMMRFTFPKGTAFGKGQTYTITFKMMFVPGVTEGLAVTNSFGITGDRVWDQCTAPSGYTATLSADAVECSTTAKVTPQRLASVRTVKAVRPLDETRTVADYQHGFVNEAVCSPDADGFVIQPCVPRTRPGQAEDWRLSVTNNGTTEFSTMVVADVLPTPGDSTLIAGFDRKSQWTPTLTDRVPTLVKQVEGRTLDVYGTTAAQADLCMAGVRNPVNLASCISATDPSKWMLLSSVVDKSEVTALLFVVKGEAGTPGASVAPGERIDLLLQTKSGALSGLAPASDPKAFNSLTVSALSSAPAGRAAELMAARDQSNIGVALITGSVSITKEISGDATDFVPNGQVFRGELRCVSLGENLQPRTFAIEVGDTVTFDYIPFGSECRVFETAASGQSSYAVSPASVVVRDGSLSGAEPLNMNIVNQYDLTSLTVRKSVQSDAESIPTGFGFEVACTFLGADLDLGADAAFTLSNNGTKTITGLPVNAKCTVEETDPRGADSVTIDATSLKADGSAYGAVTIDEDEATATFGTLAPTGETGGNVAAFTNNFGSIAELTVTKELVGGARSLGADQVFTIAVACVFEGETIYSGTVSLHEGNGWTQHVRDLIAGTVCTLTEADLLGADAVVITPNNGVDTATGVVEIPADATEPVDVTVANRYLAGSIDVTKVISGAGAEKYGTADFTTTLVCEVNGEPFTIPGGANRTVNATEPVGSYTGLPNGAQCLLTESVQGGATASTLVQGDGEPIDAAEGLPFTVVVDSAIVSNDDQAQTPVTLENRFDLAEISITKVVESDAVDAAGDPIAYGPFELTLGCTFDGAELEIDDAVRVISDGETVTWTGLPATADCTVTESDAADAVESWFMLGEGDLVEGATLGFNSLAAIEAGTNSATLVNRFDVAAVTIAKVIDGDAAAAAQHLTFTVALTCTVTDASRPDGEVVFADTFNLSKSNNWRVQVENIAAGAECIIEETETRGAHATQIMVDEKRTAGTKAVLTLAGADTQVTVTNTFRADLSSTGGSIAASVALALLLLLGGGGALLIARRRRS